MHPLVQELNQRYQPGRKFSNAACRIRTLSADGHEIILRSEPDILHFTIT